MSRSRNWNTSGSFEIRHRTVVFQLRGRQALPNNPMRFESRSDALAALGYNRFQKRVKNAPGESKLTVIRMVDVQITVDRVALEAITTQRITDTCPCGSEEFTWEDSGEVRSKPTDGTTYDFRLHPQAKCHLCNRSWPRLSASKF